MKNVFLFASILLIFSCSDKKKKVSSAPSNPILMAAFFMRPEGGADVGACYRVIKKNVSYDSTKGKDIIAVDTSWYIPKQVPALDSLKKQKVDSAGNKQFVTGYFQLSNDSVVWDIGNKNLDSLVLAKFKKP